MNQLKPIDSRNGFVVVMPAYNESSLITLALDSVKIAADNTNMALRSIIVCVNGCTDDTEELVRAWGKAPVTILSSRPGYQEALNTLIDYAIETYSECTMVKVDADAEVAPDAFRIMFGQLDIHPELVLVGGHPVPLSHKTRNVFRRIVAMILSVRGLYPMSEVSKYDVSDYHTYALTDPQPTIRQREEQSKIFFHGRLWCIRNSSLIELMPASAIGDDVYFTPWLYNRYGKRAIRVMYNANTYCAANYSLRRHWKVYRRIYEDKQRTRNVAALREHDIKSTLTLNWSYIATLPLRIRLMFYAYGAFRRIERISFRLIPYRDSFWRYDAKEDLSLTSR